jgi:hypothetical protein
LVVCFGGLPTLKKRKGQSCKASPFHQSMYVAGLFGQSVGGVRTHKTIVVARDFLIDPQQPSLQ